MRGSRSSYTTFELPPITSQGLDELSSSEDASVATVWLTAMVALFYRDTGGEEITIGYDVESNGSSDIRLPNGPVSKGVQVSVQASAAEGFIQPLKRTRASVNAAVTYSDAALEKVTDAIQPEMHPRLNPGARLLLRSQRNKEMLRLPDLEASIQPVIIGTGFYEVALDVVEADREPFAILTYDTGVVSEVHARHVANDLRRPFEFFTADPDTSIGTFIPSTEPLFQFSGMRPQSQSAASSFGEEKVNDRGMTVIRRSPLEQMIRGVLAESLDAEDRGLDDLLSLGGTRAQFIDFYHRLSEALEIALPMRVILESSSVSQLALAVVKYQVEQLSPGVVERMLADLEELSEEEARRFFGSEWRRSADQRR